MRLTKVKLKDRLILLGPPGVGKTEFIRRLAEEEARKLGKRFVDLGGELSDEVLEEIKRKPSDFYVYFRVPAPTISPDDVNYPVYGKVLVELLPPKKLYVLTLPVHGVFFIDEITNIQSPDHITMFFSLIQEKEVGWGVRLSPFVKVVLAGNTPEWSRVAAPLPEPLRAKTTIIEVDPPTVDEWTDYMDAAYGGRWERLTYAFLKLSPEDFLRRPEDEWENYPCPRNWSELAVLLYELKEEGTDDEVIEAYVRGRLGRATGARFYAFMKERLTLEEIERLAGDPERFFAQTISRKVLALYLIASRPLEELLSKYDPLLRALAEREREFFVLFLRLLKPDVRWRYATERSDLLAPVADYLADTV